MVDRRIVVVGLTVCGLAAGWFLHGLLAPPSPPPGKGEVASPRTATTDLEEGSATTASREAAFDQIYRTAKWGTNEAGVSSSGYGSKMKATALYRLFLEQFMKDMQVHSVVDAGCGDWEFSQAIDWTGIDYKGYDIVPSVIEGDKQRYAKPNIQFFQADVVDADLPPADLLISKHVLQHLPNADVKRFLTKQLPKYKYVLLTDSVAAPSLSSKNPDIQPGQFRVLDLTRPPFDVPGLKVLTYWDGANMQQVLYIVRHE